MVGKQWGDVGERSPRGWERGDGRGLLPRGVLEGLDHQEGAGGLEEGSFQDRSWHGCHRGSERPRLPVGSTRALKRRWTGGLGVQEGCRRKMKEAQLPPIPPGNRPQTAHSGTLFFSISFYSEPLSVSMGP